MIVCIRGENDPSPTPPRNISKASNNTLAEVFVPRGSPSSTTSMVKHIVIVMDALKEFSLEPLQWALHHVVRSPCIITLLGVMPWIPLPLSCKTWSDVWTFGDEDLSALKSRSELKNDYKYHKALEIIKLCEQKGAVPYMKVAMGHPLRLVVLEQTTSLHATFVVLDRHLRKNKAFFAARLPSSAVIMKDDKEVDLLKIQAVDYSDPTPDESPTNIISTPQIILSEALSELLR